MDMSSPRLVLPATPEAMACMQSIGTLEPAQVFRLQAAIANPIKLRGGTFLASTWPAIEAKPLTLTWEIADLCEKRGISVEDVRLEGAVVASCMDPAKECHQLEVVFRLATTDRAKLVDTREVVLDCLRTYLPEKLAGRDAHMLAAAYLQSMSITPPHNTEDIHASFVVSGTAGSPALSCKFVQRAASPVALDEYGVQILLSRDQLTTFLQAHANGSRLHPPGTPTPTVRFECLVGTPAEAFEALTPQPQRGRGKGPHKRAGKRHGKQDRSPLRPLAQPTWNTPIRQQPTRTTSSSLSASEDPPPTRLKDKADTYTDAMMQQCLAVVTCTCWRQADPGRRVPSTPQHSSSSASSSLRDTPSSAHIDQVVVCDQERVTEVPLCHSGTKGITQQPNTSPKVVRPRPQILHPDQHLGPGVHAYSRRASKQGVTYKPKDRIRLPPPVKF